MLKRLYFLGYLLLAATFSGCFVLGIHTKVHNPKKEKKYPEFSENDILFGALSKHRSCYDVHFYELDITIDPKEKVLSGTVDIHALAIAAFDTLQLDLYPDYTLDSITWVDDGGKLSFSRKDRAVFVSMGRTMEAGDKVRLRVHYAGQPQKAKRPPWRGGVVWKKDKAKYPWVGVACESEGASVWWPCKDHSSDEADSVVLHYSVPDDLVAVGNGVFQGKRKSDLRAGYATYSWKVHNPINTYNITFYAGDFVVVRDSLEGLSGMLYMNHYVLRDNKDKARRHFQQVKPILSFFETKFGAYPWYEDGFRLVEAPYEGMEHQSAIAYGSGYKNFGPFPFDYIMLHETAHEWWGNSVTAFDFADMWLQEGFATYAEALYVEHIQNRQGYLNYLLFERLFIKNKRPVVGPVDRRYFSYKDTDVYMKGAWILHTLRSTIDNDSIFFDIIQTFAVEHAKQLVNTNDFVQLVNEKTAMDYGWFFDFYLNQRKAPVLEYRLGFTNETDDLQLFYRWEEAPDQFKLPCTITYTNERGKLRTLRFTPGAKTKSIVLEGLKHNTVSFQFDNFEKYYGIEEVKKLK